MLLLDQEWMWRRVGLSVTQQVLCQALWEKCYVSMDVRLIVRVHQKAHRVVRTREFGVRQTEKNDISGASIGGLW